jgi:hypothetical protein
MIPGINVKPLIITTIIVTAIIVSGICGLVWWVYS